VKFDPKDHSHRDIYKLMIGAIVPRPIALVSSLGPDGTPNLAPFSFFNGVCSNPPIVCFSVSVKRDGRSKDTLANVTQTKQFVVNIVSHDFAGKMNLTSQDFPPEVNEFEIAGLTPVPSDLVKPARVAESRVSMECVLERIASFGDGGPGSGSTVFGEVKRFHVADELLHEFVIDPGRLDAIGRMGGPSYATTRDRFDLPRPG
jgi:flavin reductase (DIM6/NTAB) family NADH-FMN oxidoreductase RutF